MSDVIRFSVPLPPTSLRANNNSNWRHKKRQTDAYSMDVWMAWETRGRRNNGPSAPPRWDAGTVVFDWHYCGNQPDHSNLGGNTKALLDLLCMAPRNLGLDSERCYLGIFKDDSKITAEYRMTRVDHRWQTQVEIIASDMVRDGAMETILAALEG